MTRVNRLPNQCPRDRRNADRLSGGIKGGTTLTNVTLEGNTTIGSGNGDTINIGDGDTVNIGNGPAITVGTGGEVDIAGPVDQMVLKNYNDSTRPGAGDVASGTLIYNTSDNAINLSDGANWYGPAAGSPWEIT